MLLLLLLLCLCLTLCLPSFYAASFLRLQSLSGDRRALGVLRKACESAKCALSSSAAAGGTDDAPVTITVPGTDVTYSCEVTRELFESLSEVCFSACVEAVERALSAAKTYKAAVSEVVLFGGATHMPRVQELLREFFGLGPGGATALLVRSGSVDADEGAALGASILAGRSLHGWRGEHERKACHRATRLSAELSPSRASVRFLLSSCSPPPPLFLPQKGLCTRQRTASRVHAALLLRTLPPAALRALLFAIFCCV